MSSSYGQLLKDLQIGIEEGEKPVQKFLFNRFGIITKSVSEDNTSWDIEVAGIDKKKINSWKKGINVNKVEKKFVNKYGRTFEIKRDKASDRTGNFYYEVWSSVPAENPGSAHYSKADTIVVVRKKEFIFIDRGSFLSWVVDNLFSNTEMGIGWRKKTGRRVKKPKMRSSRHNKDVAGILIPIKDLKMCPNTEVFER